MKNIQKIIIVLIYFVIFIFLFAQSFSLTEVAIRNNYYTLLISYFICGIVFLMTILKKEYYIFEPYTIVSLLYMAIMIYRPCVDILNENYYRFGIYVMNGCSKTTVIFTISFVVFSLAYNFRISKNKSKEEVKKIGERKGTKLTDFSICYTQKVKIFCLILFSIGLISALVYYKTAGYNPILFLKNLNQETNLYIYDSNYKFLSKMAYLMIIPWIFICKFDRNILLKIITTFIMYTILLIGGARYIIIIAIIAYVVLPYIVERKSFSFKKALVLFSVLLVFCDIIAYTRVGTRTGRAIEFDRIGNFVEITDVFDSDLTIYQPLYCVVEKVPHLVPYQKGKGLIIYSLVSFLPKFIFPWKSNYDNMANIIGIVMNETSKKAGLAMPNIGEFYLEFGIGGCIICMYIFGKVCSLLKKLYLNNKYGINELVLYSVLFPFLMQIVCRGYLAIQLNSLIFIVLPYFILKIPMKKQNIRE